MSNIWKDGIFGLVVGDALGVPVEFTSREERASDPVTGLREYGTHGQPKGTWSDDSSLTLALLDSIRSLGAVDYKDIMDRFARWYTNAEYTAGNEVFDIGISTSQAIGNYLRGQDPLQCGGTGDRDNGNGSLMRILPVCLHYYEKQKIVCTFDSESIYEIHNVSALTHGHLRSQMACGFYYFMVKAIIEKEGSLIERLQNGIDHAYEYYRQDLRNYSELANFNRLTSLQEFRSTPSEEIKSSGYVIATLEATVWCLINTDSYKEAVLKAVNLGADTDTTGAVTGSLAGLFYGFSSIPEEWVESLARREWIEALIGECAAEQMRRLRK